MAHSPTEIRVECLREYKATQLTNQKTNGEVNVLYTSEDRNRIVLSFVKSIDINILQNGVSAVHL